MLELDEQKIIVEEQDKKIDDLYKTQEVDTLHISELQTDINKKEGELDERMNTVTKLISKNEQFQNHARIYKSRLEKFKKEGLASY
jgi:hypothetical protein